MNTIQNVRTTSGRTYGCGSLVPGELQYMDREYRFCHVPDDLCGCAHLMTHGNDKLIAESELCVAFEVDCDVNVFVLYADKYPKLPAWLEGYERTRLNVTRHDSRADNLKGYFGVYRKPFPKGTISLDGCSPCSMLGESWYVSSGGANYCMYTVAIAPVE